MITLTLKEAASVVACIEQYGKDAAPHAKAFFTAKERQYIAERNQREAMQKTDRDALIAEGYPDRGRVS
jgi:hypothetical protein